MIVHGNDNDTLKKGTNAKWNLEENDGYTMRAPNWDSIMKRMPNWVFDTSL